LATRHKTRGPQRHQLASDLSFLVARRLEVHGIKGAQ
jgi:hypothetical protein